MGMVDLAATSGRPFSTRDGSAYMSDRKARDKIVPLDFGGTRQPIVRIHVLGAMRATSYLGENILPRGKKARAVFGYLCLNAGQRVGRSRLASLLWDRVPDQQARTSLRQALREVSAAMGPLAHELITADVDTLKLDAVFAGSTLWRCYLPKRSQTFFAAIRHPSSLARSWKTSAAPPLLSING